MTRKANSRDTSTPLALLTTIILFSSLLLLPSANAETMTYNQLTELFFQNSYIANRNITIVDNSSCSAYPNIDSGRSVTLENVTITLNSSQYMIIEIMPNAVLKLNHCNFKNVALLLADNQNDLSSYNIPKLIIHNSRFEYSTANYQCNGNTEYRNSQFITIEPILSDTNVYDENLTEWLDNHKDGTTEQITFENSYYKGDAFLMMHNWYYANDSGAKCFGYSCPYNEYQYQKVINISKDIIIKNSTIDFSNSDQYDGLTTYNLQNSKIFGNKKAFVTIYGSSRNNYATNLYYYSVSNSQKDKIFNSTLRTFQLTTCWRTSDWSSCDDTSKTAHFRFDTFKNSTIYVQKGYNAYFLQNNFIDDKINDNGASHRCLNTFKNTLWNDNCPLIFTLLNLLLILVAVFIFVSVVKFASGLKLDSLGLLVLAILLLLVFSKMVFQYILTLWGF